MYTISSMSNLIANFKFIWSNYIEVISSFGDLFVWYEFLANVAVKFLRKNGKCLVCTVLENSFYQDIF